jgi:hypothetical protein
LASDINPTDVLDRRFLCRGNRWSCTHHSPASPWFNSPCACRPMSLITVLSEKPDQPGRTSAHAGSAIKPMQLSFEQPLDARNKPHRPLKPWWTGSRLSPEVTVQVSEQATSQNFGSPAAFTSISSGGITPKGLYPNYYMSHDG